MTNAAQTARLGSMTVSSSVTPSVKTEGNPFMAFEVLTSSSLQVKVKGDFGSGTSRMLRYYLLSSTATESSIDPDTASGALAAQDIILVPTCGAQNIELVRTAGSGTVSSCSYGSDGLTPFLLQKLIDGGISTTVTPPAIQCYRFIPDGTDELLISASARKYWGARVWTKDATPVHVKVYDKATAASESDTPFDSVSSPANATAALGAGNNALVPGGYVPLTNGLSVRAVVGIADSDDNALTTAENVVSVYWSA